MGKKDILVRGVDDSIYRRAKAAAASKGITLGNAVDEALITWAKQNENGEIQSKVDANLEFIRTSWNKLKSNKGKAVVIADGRLQGVFPTYEQARAVAQKKKDVALVFLVDRPPMEQEIEFGAELEV